MIEFIHVGDEQLAKGIVVVANVGNGISQQNFPAAARKFVTPRCALVMVAGEKLRCFWLISHPWMRRS